MANLPSLPKNPVVGDPRLASDLISNDEALRTAVNNVDNTQLTDNTINAAKLSDETIATAKLANSAVTADKLADAEKLGLSGASTVRRGKSIIATEESTTSTSYTYLATPDRVQNIVLPTDGLIFVLFAGEMRTSSATKTAWATLYLSGNQVLMPSSTSANNNPVEAGVANTATTAINLGSDGFHAATTGPYSGPILFGQGVGLLGTSGGAFALFATAGTYDVGIRFQATSGYTAYAKNRKLWVWTMGF